MKRTLKHLLSLSAMLAFTLAATPADAAPGKGGHGLKKNKQGNKIVTVSQSPKGMQGNKAFGQKGMHGKKAFGQKGVFDQRRRPFVHKAPPPRRKALMRHRMTRRAGYTWIPGSWRFSYNMGRYVWVDGYWAQTRPGQRWVQGRWAHSAYGWSFISGYWM